jgi:hypothetical protein
MLKLKLHVVPVQTYCINVEIVYLGWYHMGYCAAPSNDIPVVHTRAANPQLTLRPNPIPCTVRRGDVYLELGFFSHLAESPGCPSKLTNPV